MKKLLLILTGLFMLILLSAWTTKQLPELNPIEKLGKSIFYDKISEPDNQSCADCHVDPFWAEPEYIATMNTDELGNLQLTDAEVDAIVAFMRTLSDGYKPGKSTELEFASNAEILFTSQLPSSVGISFRIPESGKVVIDIFNITGIRVGTLLNGTLEAGNHETSVSTSELKPGIYIINMKASGQSVSAKMTII